MARITSKLQLTVPKALAEQFGIRPGDEVDLTPAGEAVRMTRRRREKPIPAAQARLRYFDQATGRQHRRQGRHLVREAVSRGWVREDLYERGRPR